MTHPPTHPPTELCSPQRFTKCLPGVAFCPCVSDFTFLFLSLVHKAYFLSLSSLPHLRVPKPINTVLFQPQFAPERRELRNQASRGIREVDITGRLSLWTLAVCHQHSLTTFLQ